MTESTLIEWAHHAFAMHFGCTKVDEECRFCYAEDWTVRRFHKAGWGPHAPRIRTAASTWKQPLAWQRKAVRDGVRRRVFCSELSDVFDNQVPDEWRADLWALIKNCPNLDWLLLTKRPQNICKMLPADWGSGWPNVWLGTTAGHQKAWQRVAALRSVPAIIRFVSVEPMLGPVQADLRGMDWIICGGETVKPGQKNEAGTPAVARYMDPAWARDLRDQCRAANVPFFLKQMTNKAPIPDDLLVREFPVRRGRGRPRKAAPIAAPPIAR
jgi:protein gp37